MDTGTRAGRVAAVEHQRRRRVGHSPDQTARMLGQSFPDVAQQTIAKAEEAIRGMLTLPGTGGTPAFVGDPPKWSEPRYNDPEYLWLLNRMSHWRTMLRGWALSGQDRFADRVAFELDDWIATSPRPQNVPPQLPETNQAFNARTPWRALEVGIRMYSSWVQVPRFFVGTRWFDGDRADRFAASVVQHAEVLSVHSPILWPKYDHNHLMMEMLGLLYAALMLGDHPQSPAWRQQATDGLVRCCENQFVEGGGQIEGCPHYHIVCLDVIARAVGGLREYGYDVPGRLLTYMRDGVGYMLQTTRPTGDIVPWGDSDPHPSTAGAVLAMWATGEPEALQLVRSLTGREHVRSVVAQAAWDVGDIDGFLLAAEKPPARLPPAVAWHKGLDQASARTSWDRNAAMVFVACRSPVNNGHAHIDPAGFEFTALGKPLLVDPGRFTYRNDEGRYRYKSAFAHNCLTIDGREPWVYVDSWRYDQQKRGVLRRVEQQRGAARIWCEHANYHPTIHRRTVTLNADGTLVVSDELDPLPAGCKVQRWFHFNSTTVTWNAERRVAHTNDDDVNVAVFASGPYDARILPGRISPGIDREYPSQRLCLEAGAFAADVVYIVAYRGRTVPDFVGPVIDWE